jgi:hypothetical protein
VPKANAIKKDRTELTNFSSTGYEQTNLKPSGVQVNRLPTDMENLQLTITGLNENMAYCETIGLSKCLQAWADVMQYDEIMVDGIGFNPNSGYVYIALESGISICSMLGREVEYLSTDFEDGTELFFDTYDEAVSSQQLFNAM